MIENITDKSLKQQIARQILESLTAWFEVEESREAYIADCADWIFLADSENGEYRGFLCLKETGRATAELAVMGVRPEYHRAGIGAALVEQARQTAREMGYAFMQVKTVQLGKYPEYDITNLFYLHCGFQEFEVIPMLWDADNPCQIYVTAL